MKAQADEVVDRLDVVLFEGLPGRAQDVALLSRQAPPFGQIFNAVAADFLAIPENRREPNAPVSYPVLWDAAHLDLVQWNGSAMQPMARNIGEALGVGATLRLLHENGQPVAEAERYASGVRVRDLHRLETTLMQLAPPRWPEDVLGAIDLTQASLGRALYKENCAHCHDARPKPVDKRFAAERDPEWRMKVIPTSFVGTDPTTADNIADHRFDLTRLGWTQDELDRLDVQLYGAPAGPLEQRAHQTALACVIPVVGLDAGEPGIFEIVHAGA